MKAVCENKQAKGNRNRENRTNTHDPMIGRDFGQCRNANEGCRGGEYWNSYAEIPCPKRGDVEWGGVERNRKVLRSI